MAHPLGWSLENTRLSCALLVGAGPLQQREENRRSGKRPGECLMVGRSRRSTFAPHEHSGL